MKLSVVQIQRSLRFSLLDGIFASGMIGCIHDYLTPFALVLGASSSHIGILNAIPNFCASLVQVKSADCVALFRSRKAVIIVFVLLQAFLLLPMMVIALRGGSAPFIFILFVVLFACCGALATPAWGSLMSDLVQERSRGEYFGWRNRVLGYVTISVTFSAGAVLHYMKEVDIFFGFALLFGCAFMFRLISWYFLRKMDEPSLILTRSHYFTFMQFIARFRKSNFAQFVIFVSLMSFSVNIASPFFAVFMIQNLSFSYLLYTVVTVMATLASFIVMSRWGRHADRIGNLKVIRITAPFIGCIPFLWILNHHPVYLIGIQIFSGFVWAGFNLCVANFIYDAVIPEKRTRCIAYYNALNGVALCFGALIGGFLLPRLPEFLGHRILTLFLISGILRFMAGMFLPRYLKEVRAVEHVNSMRLFSSMIGIRPLIGIERKTIKL